MKPSFKKEYDEFKNFLVELKCKIEKQEEHLIDELEIRAESLKNEIENSKKLISDDIREKQAQIDTKIKELLDKLGSDRNAENTNEISNFSIEKCTELMENINAASTSFTNMKLSDVDTIYNQNLFGTLVIDDEVNYTIKSNTLCKIDFTKYQFMSICQNVIIKHNSIKILAFKSTNAIHAELMIFNLNGKLNERKEYCLNKNLLSAALFNKVIVIIAYDTNNYYMIKLNDDMKIVHFISTSNKNSYYTPCRIFCLADDKFYMGTRGSSLYVYDKAFKYLSYAECKSDSKVFEINNECQISFLSDESCLIYKDGYLKELSIKNIKDCTLIKNIYIGHEAGLVAFTKSYFILYDSSIDKSILFKKDLETNEIIARYKVDVDDLKKITSISIDHGSNVACLWCDKSYLIMINLC